MMNMHMPNEIECYLQLGSHNADNISLTELLFSSAVVERLSPGCKAYVEHISDWQPLAPVPCDAAHILSMPVVSRMATDDAR